MESETVITKKISVLHITNVLDNRFNSGSARVAKELIQDLSSFETIKQFLLHFEESMDSIYLHPNNVNIVVPVGSSGVLKQTRALFKFIKIARKSGKVFDVVHWHSVRVLPFFFLIPASKTIVTIHDATLWEYRRNQPISTRFFLFWLTILQRFVHTFVVVSQTALLQSAAWTKINTRKIKVIPWYTNFKSLLPQPIPELRGKSNILVCVSRWQKIKNVESFISALGLIPKITRASWTIVLVGKPVGNYNAPLLEASRQNLYDEIIWLKDLDDQQLAYLYDHSKLSVHPSLREGFGLTVLESLSRGCLPLVHSGTATAEFQRSGAKITDMLNPEGVAKSIQLLMSQDYSSEFRNQLAENADSYAKNITLDLYCSLYNRGNE